jgi:hypothetical protein
MLPMLTALVTVYVVTWLAAYVTSATSPVAAVASPAPAIPAVAQMSVARARANSTGSQIGSDAV